MNKRKIAMIIIIMTIIITVMILSLGMIIAVSGVTVLKYTRPERDKIYTEIFNNKEFEQEANEIAKAYGYSCYYGANDDARDRDIACDKYVRNKSYGINLVGKRRIISSLKYMKKINIDISIANPTEYHGNNYDVLYDSYYDVKTKEIDEDKDFEENLITEKEIDELQMEAKDMLNDIKEAYEKETKK